MMTCYARVMDDGGFLVPAELVKALGVRPGDVLALEQDGSAIRLKSYAEIVREGQQAFRATIQRSFTVDEFLAARAAEAARE